MDGFRFRWRRRPNWGTEAYDAWMGEFRVGQITPVQTHGSGLSYWAWRILLAPIAGPGSAGKAPSPRDAARALEAAFPTFVQSAPRFAMQAEREVILRAALQLPHTVELDHALAVARGEHVRPVSVTDAAGWSRWLAEERRLGNRQWISPEEMREWFGDAWQDPRAKKEETANLPARALITPSAPAPSPSG